MQARMTRRKLLIGMTSTCLGAAALGVAVFPASAVQRELVVTLVGGKTLTVSVDVPAGTPLDRVVIPGVSTPILSIAPVGVPAPVSVAPQAVSEVPAAVVQEAQRVTGKRTRRPRAQDEAVVVRRVVVEVPRRVVRRVVRRAQGAPTQANPTFSLALPGAPAIGVPNFFIEKFRIPPFLLSIYQAAGVQYGVRWELLAAINEIETDYGRNLNVSTAGAVGWMQFLPSTWRRYGLDANGDGVRDPYNPVDAIFSAARYLRAADAEHDLRAAIFAYNHADWYVDSILLRARVIGGLPTDLVGSLAGLTQGHFPVHARATYADDLAERAAAARIARGRNIARSITADPARRGINIYSRAGAPVIAVQDGKITKIGRSGRLGRFVQLQDPYGNTYTYAQLKKVARAYPAPRKVTVTKAQIARELRLPAADPKPTQAASAGTQAVAKTVAKTLTAVRQTAAKPAVVPARVTVAKERLFANPKRPVTYRHGGQAQLLDADRNLGHYTVFTSKFSRIYSLKRSDVQLRPLRVGSRVAAGTILGRIGRTSRLVAPHLLFEIRPAGRGAPRIDPKPILDGWKLLESTAIYRAVGKNPFFGPDAKTASIGQILLMSKEQLAQRVLADPRVDIYDCGRRDIQAGVIDRRILATLEFLAASGLDPTITSLRCGHGYYTASGNVSEHSFGDAVDIAKINGIPISGHQGPGSIAELTIRRLLTLQGVVKPHQIISLMTFQNADNTFAMADHADHIHIGFQPLYGQNTKLGRQLAAVLKPTQWIKLIDRIATITNPTIPTHPSRYAIKTTTHATHTHTGE
jgi:hypothetical protein